MSLKKQSIVHEEIEKTLASNLRRRLLDDINGNEAISKSFDERDIKELKRNNVYFRLFVRARQGDIEKAYDMMVKSLKWRKSYKINVLKEEMLNEDVMKKGLLYYHNFDKQNNPILIFQGNKYGYKGDRSMAEQLQNLFVFLLEIKYKHYLGRKITVICDHQDATLDNMDLDFFKFVVDLFSIYYPNMLDSFIVLNVSWRLTAVWKVIKNWLSNDMLSKFKFIDKSKLPEYVDKSKILSSMDGEDTFQYTYPPLPDNTSDDSTTLKKSELSSSGENASLDEGEWFEDADVDEPQVEGNVPHVEDSEPRVEGGDSRTQASSHKSMGATMGTQVRNRLKDHFVANDSELTDDNSEDPGLPLVISPDEEIVFREVEHVHEVQETLSLRNVSTNTVIFKVKTNNAACFRVRPNVGALLPGSSKEITLMLLLKGDAGHDKHQYIKDKFLILFTEILDPITISTDIAEKWKDVPKIDINEHKISCRVLDINGFEKRPKTIEDVLGMSVNLKQQILQLHGKLDQINKSHAEISTKLQQQTIVIITGFVFLAALLYWFH